jgi:biotin operon repressor
MKEGLVKKRLEKKNFYLPILGCLKESTNLSKITKQLSISKQQLNYYLRELKKKGFIIQKGNGWYEVVKGSKNSTKHEFFLSKDSCRGHANVWEAKFSKEIKDWDKRIELLKEKGIHYILVGAKENTPRIKMLGRKIWLCNDHIRIYDRKDESYYGLTAKESRYLAFQEIKRIVDALNRKLGVSIKPSDILFQREHYALIKNDLAIEENQKNNIWHIKDEEGEWLLVDDSLGKGGELETIGKKAFKTNIPMQKWWNNQKETNFKITPDFILNTMNGIQANQNAFAENMVSHVKAVQNLGNSAEASSKSTELLAQSIKDMQNAFIEQIELLRTEIKGIKER